MSSNSFHAQWIAEVLQISIPSQFSQLHFSAIVTDSRKIVPGCLFVAIQGDTFDGHDFIAAAIEKGALGILTRRSAPQVQQALSNAANKICFFQVEETIAAYREIAKAWRARFKIPVALVAGSNGKTTTKELLHALFQGKWERVLKTQGSQNGFVGIPLTLLELNETHQAAVIEVGIDEPGTMKGHVDIVAPDVSVLTVIQPEHLEKLIDLDTVAREEGYALSETLARGGAIAVNCDDSRIAPHLTSPKVASPKMTSPKMTSPKMGRKLGYSLSQSNPSLLMGKVNTDLKTLEVSGADLLSPEHFPLPLPGKHNATNLLAAIAVARLFGVTPDEMRRGLSRFIAPEGRSQVKTLADGTKVICDYYNSQPASLRAGIDLLKDLSGPAPSSQRWLCLADMLELGPQEEKFHREPATWIRSLEDAHVLLYGNRMKWLQDELKVSGFKGRLKHFSTHAELAAELAQNAEPGSTILIKGSNSMKMGEVWKAFEQARRAP
jgi:UDP-N-acetylmuramoyl-tripeptide--D-alanyl-D-alanine ligase